MTPVVCFGLFLGLGTVVSFEDWSRRKIRNRLILLGLLACVGALGWLLANSALGHRDLRVLGLGEFYLPWRYYPRVLLHLALSFAAALTLWRFSVWPAGDAKFFTVCAFFTALIEPNLPGFPKILFLLMLINVFVPAGVIFAGETVVIAALRLPRLRQVDWRVWGKAQLDKISVRVREAWPYRVEYLILVFNLVAAFVGMQAAQRRFTFHEASGWMPLLVFVGMCLCWQVVSAVLRRKSVGALAFAGLAAWLSYGLAVDGWETARRLGGALRMTLNFGLFLMLGRIVFYWFIERESRRALRPDRLEAGVILSDQTRQRLEGEKELSGRLHRSCVDGLTAAEASALKDWFAGRAADEYAVYHTIPFAFWIFLGTLLTLARHDSVSFVSRHLASAQAALR